jgi:hypothetical protein
MVRTVGDGRGRLRTVEDGRGWDGDGWGWIYFGARIGKITVDSFILVIYIISFLGKSLKQFVDMLFGSGIIKPKDKK